MIVFEGSIVIVVLISRNWCVFSGNWKGGSYGLKEGCLGLC